MKVLFSILVVILLLQSSLVLAQSNFSLTDDSICVDAPFSPINQSANATSYLWHFNSANMGNRNMAPIGSNLGNKGFTSNPIYIAIAEDSSNYYTFTTNYRTKSITRNSYSGSLLNVPVSSNIPVDSLSSTYELGGIQIIKGTGNNWYGFVVGGRGTSNARLTCLYFGQSLQNNPTVLYSRTFAMNFPKELEMVNIGGSWIGFTANQNSNYLTQFNFDNGLNKPPKATNIILGGMLKYPYGLSKPVKDRYNNWHMFVTCRSNDTIKRIQFGANLFNLKPSITNLNSAVFLRYPTTVKIIQDCNHTYGLVPNSLPTSNSGYMSQLNFVNGIENEPEYLNLGNLGALNTPNGMTEIIRAENDIFAFVANTQDSTLSRIQYQPRPTPATSTDSSPTSLYPDSGVYNINLVAWQDAYTKTCSCTPITVLEKPTVFIGNDTTLCPYDKIALDPINDYNSYQWNSGSNNKTIITDTVGTYILEVTNTKGCANSDTINISHFPDNLFLGNDTTFLLGESIILNAGEYAHTTWSTGITDSPAIEVKKPGIYAVMVKDYVPNSNNQYCYYSDTIVIEMVIDVPNFFTPNNDGYNDIWAPNLLFHYPEAEIFIYDRFGKKLAHFKGDSEGWNGKFNNKTVDTDTYWYVIDLKDGSKPIRGALTVKTK